MPDFPATLSNTLAQFRTFLTDLVTGGLGPAQNIVLNSTILPFDIATDTPFYNDEVFRQYADRTFSGGVEGLTASSAAFQAERFSSQYKALMNIVTAQVDQNHPEIARVVSDLQSQLDTATSALTKKINDLDAQWQLIVTARQLSSGTQEYDLQHAAWFAQVRYADQLQSFTDVVDRINAQIQAARRSVYTDAERAVLDNASALTLAYNVARPWTPQVERSFQATGKPLTEIVLANPANLVPAMFDSSPLVFPIGDLVAFLTKGGEHSFNTTSQRFNLSASESSWNASGSGRFLGWSFGGGGSGSSSASTSMSTLRSITVSFANLSEYLADRSAWFNPGVLGAAAVFDEIKNRPEVAHLQYIGVSLIIARGTTVVLNFQDSTTSSDWSQRSFNASGGFSCFGFGFGGGGGSRSTNFSVDRSTDGLTITIKDDADVARVLGARVESFLPAPSIQKLSGLKLGSPSHPLMKKVNSVLSGETSYIDFQKERLS